MDHELIAYLDARFREFDARFGEFGARFRESAQQIEGLREDINQQFAREREETNRQFTSLRGELEVRFTRVEETSRHAHVLIEGLYHRVGLLAEAFSGFDDKLEAVRSELKEEIGEVRILLHQSYRHLDRRIG
jgi:hypothetical protein